MVDHDMAIDELATSWINGNRKDVIGNLSQRHPSVTALLFVEGQLSEDDIRMITNRLMDDFIDIRDKFGLDATCR